MTLSTHEIQKIVTDALRDSGVMTAPINPEHVAEALGVNVVFFEDTNEDVLKNVAGFYDFDERKIYVNKGMRPSEKMFTIAHELGHHLMHQDYANSENYVVLPRFKDYGASPIPNEEKEADQFALLLLMPKDELDKYKKILSSTERLAEIFAVSPNLIRDRLAIAA